MEFIKTYFTQEAYDKHVHKAPSISFIIETGDIIYLNNQLFNNDFNNDFALLDLDFYKQFFTFYD